VFNMKNKKKVLWIALAAAAIFPVYAQQLGAPTDLQRELNDLPPIPIAGKNLKFTFGGSTWVATVNGENLMAGTIEAVDIEGGTILTLKQTHIWGTAAVGGAATVGKAAASAGKLGGILGKVATKATSTWVATPGPEIFLDYDTTEPRATLKVASEERKAEARASGVRVTGY
jgi:hypothetical protein